MNRNVYRSRRTRAVDGTETVEERDPPPHEKLLKYFPEAALALYIAVDPILRQLFDRGALDVALWVGLILSLVLCWLYLTNVWNVTRRTQLLISELALVTYVAAIGGPFTAFEGYKTAYGSIAAIILTAFMVFLPAPKPPAE